MKASELIQRLEELKKEHGDLEVEIYNPFPDYYCQNIDDVTGNDECIQIELKPVV